MSWLRHIQVGKPVATFSILLTSILTLSFLTELIFLISFLSVSVRALGISCSDLLLRYSDLRVSLYLCLHCDICIRHMWARLDMYSFIYPNYSDKICVILYLFYSLFISVHFLHMLYITKLQLCKICDLFYRIFISIILLCVSYVGFIYVRFYLYLRRNICVQLI